MVYVFLADGFEEIEALAPCDLLRRAEVETCLVGVSGKRITGAHGICIEADKTVFDISADDDFEMIVLPGGSVGTQNLAKSEEVGRFIERAAERGRYVAAICAAPTILGERGLLEGKCAVCYPGLEKKLIGATVSAKDVVCDDIFVTARGMGVSVEFGLMLVGLLCGDDTATKLREQVIA